MTNTGVAPYDPNTLVGQVRVLTGDVTYGTPSGGYAEYELFSDAEITAYLSIAEDNILRASGYAYSALAARASVDAKSVKDFDLSVDLRNRSDKLQATADAFFNQADEKDVRDGVLDVFEIGASGRDFTYSERADIANWVWNV